VIPPVQHDAVSAAEMIDVLRENGLEAHRASRAFTTRDGRTFAAGSTVLLAAQPMRPFLLEMMERQRYPEIRQGPDTHEIFRPYDVTAWTLPLLMGVSWSRVDEPFDAELEKLSETPWPAGMVVGEGAGGFVLSPAANRSALAINAWLARGIAVSRSTEAFAIGEERFPPGTFLIDPRAASDAEALAKEQHLRLVRVASMPEVPRRALTKPRIALYKPWRAEIDEGWTRFVLDGHGFEYESLDNTAVRRGDLNGRFDVIVLPDMTKEAILGGGGGDDQRYVEPMPSAYSGGIGPRGAQNLERFVEQGGTLVCLGESSELALTEMNLPVRDVVSKVSRQDYALPGTLVRLEVDPAQPIGYGMPATTIAYDTNGPVFATSIPAANASRSVVARFPAEADEVVVSGWSEGIDQIAGRAAIVTAGSGRGNVVLFGVRPQHRGQTHGTYKLLFNAIYSAGMK